MSSLGGENGGVMGWEWWVLRQGPGGFGWNCQRRALWGGTFELRPNRGHCRPLFECHSKGTKKPLSIGRGCTRTPLGEWIEGGPVWLPWDRGRERERFLLLDIPSFYIKMGLDYIHCSAHVLFPSSASVRKCNSSSKGLAGHTHSGQPAPLSCHSPGG